LLSEEPSPSPLRRRRRRRRRRVPSSDLSSEDVFFFLEKDDKSILPTTLSPGNLSPCEETKSSPSSFLPATTSFFSAIFEGLVS